MAFNIIPPQVPFTTPDGRIAREWYIFLLNLFESNGSGNNALTQDQFETLFLAGMRMPNSSSLEAAVRDLATQQQALRTERSAIEALTRRTQDLEQIVLATFGRQPTSPPASGAPPTASVGLTAVNGSASTFMLSDAAPALSQAISPTWVGSHTFDPPSSPGIVVNMGSVGAYGLQIKANSGTAAAISLTGNGNSFASSDFVIFQNNDNVAYIVQRSNANLRFQTNGANRLDIAGGGAVTVNAPTSGDALTLSNVAGANALVVNGNAAGTPVLRANTQATTGTQTATFTATNKPGSATTAPSKWLPVNLDGTTYYIPCWT